MLTRWKREGKAFQPDRGNGKDPVMELGILGLGSEYVTHIAGRVRDQMRLYGHNVHSLVGHVEFSLYLLCLYLLWVIFFFFLFMATLTACGSSQGRGQIRAAAAGLHRSHSNTRSLTHWLRPGIKPAFLGTWSWDPTLLSHNGNSLLCIICGRIIMQKLKVCQGFIVPDFKNLSYDVRFFFFFWH